MPRRGRQGSCRSAPQPSARTEAGTTEPPAQRLDKWLWFARLARTRTLAARLVEDGKVRVNREKVLKPAHNVRPGDVITAALGGRVRVARVTDAGKRRGPAEEARELYEDLTPPMEAQTPAQQSGQHGPKRAEGSGRPTKRERRKLDALRAQDTHEQP